LGVGIGRSHGSAAMVMVFFTSIFWCCDVVVVAGLWVVVVGSLALPESRSSITYLNRPFRKSKSIITI
jgi:hypothetical protein